MSTLARSQVRRRRRSRYHGSLLSVVEESISSLRVSKPFDQASSPFLLHLSQTIPGATHKAHRESLYWRSTGPSL